MTIGFIRTLFCFSIVSITWVSFLASDPAQEFPVLYKGRYRPAEAYARLWFYELAHRQTLKKDELKHFHTLDSSSLLFLWSLEFKGSASYQNAPLFWVGSAELKKLAGLPLTQDHFSYLALHEISKNVLLTKEFAKSPRLNDNWKTIITSLKEFEKLKNGIAPLELAYQLRFSELKQQGTQPQEIADILEHEYPIGQRLHAAGSLFKSLPSRLKTGDWLPLKALTIQVYDASTDSLQPVGNFSLYSDEHFEAIRHAYFKAMETVDSADSFKEANQSLVKALHAGYLSLAGKMVQQAHGKSLFYPNARQLWIEFLYMSFPWIPLLILVYGFAMFLLIASVRFPMSYLQQISLLAFGAALLLHTAVLAMRCYILQRPPVSNMFETVIYVPWVTGCVCFLFPIARKQPLALIAACTASILLLLIIEITGLNQNLDQVQAVLDSQFWLMIHVLLIVGSYGIFILAAVLGHFYLFLYLMGRKKEEGVMPGLSKLILQALYGGTALLVCGTILGGVWAAESWGRFWDWDPKESWAFISSCFYLIWIHAYRFHRIGSFGLAMGAVSGLLAISFTWYGVNYILGTGLHSYGFGSGGEQYYYAFLAGESLFLSTLALVYQRRNTPQTQRL